MRQTYLGRHISFGLSVLPTFSVLLIRGDLIQIVRERDYLCIWYETLEKKWEYNEAVHQLFIDFKKACDSVRREILYIILIEFGTNKETGKASKNVFDWNV